MDDPAAKSPNRNSSCATTGAAGCLSLVLLTFLLVLPGSIGVAIVIVGLLLTLVFVFHYVVWGRAMTAFLNEQKSDDNVV